MSSSLEAAASFTPLCQLFCLADSPHVQQKGLSFTEGAKVNQKPLEIREGEGDSNS